MPKQYYPETVSYTHLDVYKRQVLGGVRADMEHQFQMRIFVSGFFINGIVAIGLVWLGKQLNMDLSIAAIVVFGSRIFYNFSKIRRFLLNKRQKEAMIGEE